MVVASSVARGQQHADTTRIVETVVLPCQVVFDTSSRLYGANQVPRALGASMGVLDSATNAASGAHTLSELLAGRVPGVSVLRSSGVVGAGSRVRLRGASSFLAAREPILVVDGVRVDGTQDSPGLALGGQQPSRLDEIAIDQVARVEVLRGPAAAALYGTDAAGGVIRITTLAPARGKPTWTAFAEGGGSADGATYPANYSTGSGITDAGTCRRADAALGTCTPGPLLRWSPLEDASPFRTAARSALGASLSGGAHRLGMLGAGSAIHEQGVLAPNATTRYAGRLNVDVSVARTVGVALRTAYVDSHTNFPYGDGRLAGALIAGLSGNAVDDPVDRGYRTERLFVSRDSPTDDRVRRWIGSVAASWQPAHWLMARATAGGERLRRDDARTTSIISPFGSPTATTIFQGSTGRDTRGTFAGTATAAFRLAPSLATETTIGVERLTSSSHATDSVGNPPVRDLLDVRSRARVTGVSATERLAWHDRRYLGIGVRRDVWSLTPFATRTFVSADAAWVIGDEPFFPHSPSVSRLRLRAAYGRSADFRTYPLLPVTSTPPYPEAPVARELPGETVSELEIGADALLFQHVWVDATWYRQHSPDALMPGCCFGFPGGWTGAWRTTGLDAGVTASLVRSPRAAWTARLDASLLASRVEALGMGRSSQSVGPALLPLVRFRNAVRHPIGGVWGNPIRVRDANGDGVVTPAEVSVADAAAYLGSSTPTREIGLASTLTLRRVTFNVLVDYRGGFVQVNATEDARCEFRICRAQYDPGASLGDQARAVAVDRSGAGFVEDARFVKLREIGLTWRLLPGWAGRHGAARFDLTVTGRNLVTLTRYSGLDPEVNYGGQASLGTTDWYTLPLPRTLIVRLDARH
jgi:TonB-dependent SusC/RagA subfamily outer membrane receptor